MERLHTKTGHLLRSTLSLFFFLLALTIYFFLLKKQILLNKLHKKFPPLHECKKGLSQSFYRTVASCLTKDPAQRLVTLSSILSSSPFFSRLESFYPSFSIHRPTAHQLLHNSFFRQAKDRQYVVTHLVERVQQMRQEMTQLGSSFFLLFFLLFFLSFFLSFHSFLVLVFYNCTFVTKRRKKGKRGKNHNTISDF